MEQKAFLNDKRSMTAQSQEHSLDVSLVNKTGLLPKGAVESSLSLYQLYMDERDNSSKYRVILTVNPVCSNVLFNMKTEVVQKEGTPQCVSLDDDEPAETPLLAQNSSKLTRKQAIRDTEYSSPDVGKYVYHCGLDIFNNHMLRSNGFLHVNPYNRDSEDVSTPVYNTVADYRRNANGDILQENVNSKHTLSSMTDMHLYQYDTLLPFDECYLSKLKEQDGWYGFTNPGTIDVTNNNMGVDTNRMMANNKACEFIDMYPDRSLYSFIPKYNKEYNRMELNWDYCLTYPYSSDTLSFKRIMGNEKMVNSAMRFFYTFATDVNGNEILRCRTLIPHTLQPNDRIRIYYGSDASKVIKATIRVVSVGDSKGEETNRWFSVYAEALDSFMKDMEEGVFFKKVVNGAECEYYERKMKRLDKPNGDKLRSSLGRQAFAENIYGDKVAQVIYTDDVDVAGLTDNLGAPLSDIYFTVVKRNKGHEWWYEEDEYNREDIEYSHCFGKVTAGYDMGDITSFEGLSGGTFDYRNFNINYLHNVDVENLDELTKDCWGDVFASATPLSNGVITIEEKIYPGDLVEFSPSEYQETVLAPCQFRFNTAQRETLNEKYKNLFQDALYYDDYDVIPNSDGTRAKFTILEIPINGRMDIRDVPIGEVFRKLGTYEAAGNIWPEGYRYIPHYDIKIRERDSIVNTAPAELVNYGKEGLKLELDEFGAGRILTIVSPIEYQFKKDDTVALYNVKTQEVVWAVVYENTYDTTVKIFLETRASNKIVYDGLEPGNPDREWFVFVSTLSVPTYARYVPSLGAFVWRRNVPFSQMDSNSDLFNTPFANGCHYVEPRFNIFVQRQDPDGSRGMLVPLHAARRHPMRKYALYGQGKIDLSGIKYIASDLGKVCY